MRTASMKRGRMLPPYAKEILAARRTGNLQGRWGASPDGLSVPVTLCVGENAWIAARQWSGHRLITLLPPGEDPAAFDWSCLRGADPVLLWRCGQVTDDVRALMKAVMRDGTERALDLVTGVRYNARREGGHRHVA